MTSVAQFYSIIITICGALMTVSGAVTVIVSIIKKAKEPNDKQNERLTNIETRLAKHDELLDNDNKRLVSIEEGNRVTQKALLALLAHGIDGNEIEAMRSAKDELQRFLISK